MSTNTYHVKPAGGRDKNTKQRERQPAKRLKIHHGRDLSDPMGSLSDTKRKYDNADRVRMNNNDMLPFQYGGLSAAAAITGAKESASIDMARLILDGVLSRQIDQANLHMFRQWMIQVLEGQRDKCLRDASDLQDHINSLRSMTSEQDMEYNNRRTIARLRSVYKGEQAADQIEAKRQTVIDEVLSDRTIPAYEAIDSQSYALNIDPIPLQATAVINDQPARVEADKSPEYEPL